MNKTLLSIVIGIALAQSVWAEVVTDGSLGASTRLSGAMTIPQSLGTTKGDNLFHSFNRFNINTGESATFTGDSNLKNVISRVTGGQISIIDGLLKSQVGNANFYFINPAGVTFGANAKVDVPASFHVSTADNLKFSDGTTFSANPSANALSVAEPISFGFVNTQSGNITIQNSNIKFKEGSDVSFSGHDVIIDKGDLTAKSGNIHVYAVGNTATDLAFDAQSNTALTGNITMSATYMDASGNEKTGSVGGELLVQGGDISLNKTYLDSNTYGSGNAGNVFVTGNNISLNGGHLSSNAAGGSGNAGNIVVTGKAVTVNGIIESDTYYSTGNAGNIEINSDNLTVTKDGLISSDTYDDANAGNISISSNTVNVLNGGRITSNAKFRTGNAGDVFITANQINVAGRIETDTDTDGHAGNVSITAKQLNVLNGGNISSKSNGFYGSGRAGDVFISSDTLNVLNGGHISSDTTSLGHAGDVIINANTMLIDGQGKKTGITSDTNDDSSAQAGNAGNIRLSANQLTVINQGLISSNTQGAGHAGNINIDANQILLDGYADTLNITGITSDSSNDTLNYAGNAGNISINAKALSVVNEAQITSDTYGIGAAGDVDIQATNILVNGFGHGAWISSDSLNETSNQAGNAGNVSISANQLNIVNGGTVSSDTYGSGNAGNILINAYTTSVNGQNNTAEISSRSLNDSLSHTSDAGNIAITGNQLNVLNAGKITTATSGTGNAGIIDITNNYKIYLENNAIISSSTTGAGSAGLVKLTAPLIVLNNASISAQASASSQGQTGDINIKASKALTLNNNANISIKNDATILDPNAILPSSINIFAPDINLNNSEITTEATGNVDAGDININFSHWLTLDPSFITTAANTGNGGNINIIGGQLLYLQDSGIFTSVKSAKGNGGNINITADYLALNTGAIQANAVGGSGGDINLKLQALISSNNRLILGGRRLTWRPFANINIIQAASDNGINGTINVTSPQFDISASISGLDTEQLAMPEIKDNLCDSTAMLDSSLSRAGKGGIPSDETRYAFIPATDSVSNSNDKHLMMPTASLSKCK